MACINSRIRRLSRSAANVFAAACLVVSVGMPAAASAATTTTTATPISLSDVPLVLVEPAHPQVLFIVGNSQSMDGDLSGAIMTGSGTVTANQNSSSPVDYAVPTGFTPPSQVANASGYAPYTYTDSSGVEYDNSASRLNVAKAAVQATIDKYAAVADFGLMDFQTASPGLYKTWVYYMSNSGGFTFAAAPISGVNTYPNPCYLKSSDPSCQAIDNYYTGKGVSGALTDPYLVASVSSDDPSINDVLYAGGEPSNFVTYNGPHPGSPFPPNFSLSKYNSGSVYLSYYGSAPNIGSFATGPTNAGYVPYSDEVWYAERGFGFYSNPTSDSGNLLLGISSASTGNSPTPSQISTYVAKFQPYLAPETNQTSSGEIKATAVQSPLAGPLDSALSYYTGSSAPPSNNGCTAKRYVVLVTDGLPTEDLDGNNWPPLGSVSAQQYGVTATFDATTGALQSTNDQALQDTIDKITALKAAGIDTYVVGLGAGVDPTKNPSAAATLKAMAVAGGTNNYLAASTPAAVATQFQSILQLILASNVSTSSAAVDSTSLNTGSHIYQSRFSADDSPYGDWTGNLLEFNTTPLSPPLPASCTSTVNGQLNTSASCATWNAQSLLDGTNWNTGRKIVTYDPGTASGAPFRWASLDTSQQTDLKTSSTDTLGPDRVDYLRGDTSKEVRNGGPFRNRSHILGDIVDSNPLYVGQPDANYPDASYSTFKQSYVSSPRTPMIYVGANDGMLHAFRADTGQEVFAFVPNAVFGNLKNLADPNYNSAHKFYVDGSPSAGDVLFSNGTWHTVLVGGLRNGGNSIYALDITDPTAVTTESGMASKVLWEFTDADMGMSYSRPVIARMPSSSGTQFLTVFGSGYNNAGQTPYLYFVNAETGSLVAKIDLCGSTPKACDTSLPNGLSSPTVISTTGTDVVDRVYVGDLQGHMWVIDASNTDPTKWTASLLFTATDSSGNPQPITDAPAVTRHPTKPGYLVLFGTGRLISYGDVSDLSTQSFYGVWDNLGTTKLLRTNLVQQTIQTVNTSNLFNGQGQVRIVSNNSVDWNTEYGWYMDLPASGERSITDPQLLMGRVMFTTYVPSTNSCAVSGSSWLMVVNFENGGAFSQPEIDVNGDGTYTSLDQVLSATGTPENPGGINLGPGYSASPTAVYNLPNSTSKDVKFISQQSGAITKVNDHGSIGPGRLSWQQLQ